MKFLLDVCASSHSLRTLLADLGPDVLLAVDVDPRASDETLLDLARRQGLFVRTAHATAVSRSKLCAS